MHLVEKYFGPLPPHQADQFKKLGSLYAQWNQHINVISRKDIHNLYLHHVLHSLSMAMVVRFRPGTVIIDAGTGGGFPGIPLAIMFPAVHFILVDSIAKKIRVVEDILTKLELANAVTRLIRMENLEDKADFVVSRAVTEIPRLFNWARKNLIPGGNNTLPNGLLALKGGALDEELKAFGTAARIFSLKEFFDEAYFDTKKLVYIPCGTGSLLR
jgi:16S rRNA (guanine527-N7)-methyltransferase